MATKKFLNIVIRLLTFLIIVLIVLNVVGTIGKYYGNVVFQRKIAIYQKTVFVLKHIIIHSHLKFVGGDGDVIKLNETTYIMLPSGAEKANDLDNYGPELYVETDHESIIQYIGYSKR